MQNGERVKNVVHTECTAFAIAVVCRVHMRTAAVSSAQVIPAGNPNVGPYRPRAFAHRRTLRRTVRNNSIEGTARKIACVVRTPFIER